MPASAARATCRSSSAGSMVRMPRPPPPSYGSSSAAVCDPSAPSVKILQCPVRSHSSPSPVRRPASIALSRSPRGMPMSTRRKSSRRALSRWNASCAFACSRSSSPVIPRRHASRCPRRNASRHSSADGAGTTASASAFAFSFRMPVGLPPASRSSAPPAGSAVAPVMPAMRIASVLSQRAWPSRLRSAAGRPAVARSSSAAVGQRPQRFLSKRPPRTHAPGGRARAADSMRDSASSSVAASRRST